jgi:hypothetical protein
MRFSTRFRQHIEVALACAAIAWLTGCGSGGVHDQAVAAQNQEKERLLAENQDLAQVKADNEEVQRLKKENQDLAKLRSQYQEAGRLRKDNAQLRDQVAKLTPKTAGGQAGGTDSAAAAAASAAAAADAQKAKEMAQSANTINEGDEVLIDPKSMKQLVPDIDWEKLDRKEPIGVKALLEKDGIQITNIDQLKEMGLTNYIIRRAPFTNPPPGQASP